MFKDYYRIEQISDDDQNRFDILWEEWSKLTQAEEIKIKNKIHSKASRFVN